MHLSLGHESSCLPSFHRILEPYRMYPGPHAGVVAGVVADAAFAAVACVVAVAAAAVADLATISYPEEGIVVDLRRIDQ